MSKLFKTPTQNLKASLEILDEMIADERFETGKIIIWRDSEGTLKGQVKLDRVEISETCDDIVELVIRMGNAARELI